MPSRPDHTNFKEAFLTGEILLDEVCRTILQYLESIADRYASVITVRPEMSLWKTDYANSWRANMPLTRSCALRLLLI